MEPIAIWSVSTFGARPWDFVGFRASMNTRSLGIAPKK
jgi:hypothetical protein